MKLSLTPETERLIEEKVSSGRYRSADEVVREGLKRLDERDNGGSSASAEKAAPEQLEAVADKAGKVSDIIELFKPIWASVPESEWEKLPRDLSINLDHYLYGAPKRSE